MIEPRDALSAWPVPAPWTIRPTQGGTNNRSVFVDSPAGSFFLRLSQDAGAPARIRYEHVLLRRLHEAGLSFSVPQPLATSAGETFVVTGDVVVSLFPVIAGAPPAAGDIAQAAVCGAALGELDAALAVIETDPPPGLPHFSDLPRARPLVDEGPALLAGSPGGSALLPRLRNLFAELIALLPEMSVRLPWQVIHGDLFRANILLRGDRVSGILDFEFAAPGPRAMELAVAVRGFSSGDWGTESFWRVVAALAAGYRRRVALAAEEIDALPTLLLLREATSWVHWVGRCRQGLTTPDDIWERAQSLLRLDDRLRAHGEELIRRVARPSITESARSPHGGR